MRGYQDRTCVRCGVVFRGTIRAQYCSPKCKVYAYRERKDLERVIGAMKMAPPELQDMVDRVPAGDE